MTKAYSSVYLIVAYSIGPSLLPIALGFLVLRSSFDKFVLTSQSLGETQRHQQTHKNANNANTSILQQMPTNTNKCQMPTNAKK